jgi:hypothetical protein
MNNKRTIEPIKKEQAIVVYTSSDGAIKFDVNFDSKNETFWLTQAQLVELFERDLSVISRHINNIFKEEEVPQKSNLQKMQVANSDKPVVFYSLDVIISVGYRVKSKRGVEFRKWATSVLKEHFLNGLSINTRRLERIENDITNILKNQNTQQTQTIKNQLELIQQLKQPLTINNYIDNNPAINTSVNVNIDIKTEQNKLERQLSEIKVQLTKHPDLSTLIEQYKKDLATINENAKVRKSIFKFISDLGDNQTPISKLLSGAGITKSLLLNTYNVGMTIIKYFGF